MKLPAALGPTAFGGVCPPERPVVDLLGALLQLGAPPPDELFAALLTTQTARTAPAEGQTTETPDSKPAQPATTDALVAALPLPAPALPVPVAVQPAPKAVAAPATVDPKLAAPSEAAPKAIAPTTDAPTAAAAPEALAPSVAAPKEPAAPKDAAPRKVAPEDLAPKKDAPKPAAPKAAKPAEREAAPAPKQAAAKPDVPAPTKTADATAPVAVAVKEVVPSPAHVHAASEPRPVLRAERIEALVRLATRHGAAEARMELHPQELGSVVVKLRVTSDGLQATFTASNPDAVPELQQAGDDLRRSLEAKGLTLASLDVRAEGREAGERRERDGGRSKDRRSVEQIDDEPLTTVTTSIPAGELVDVHA